MIQEITKDPTRWGDELPGRGLPTDYEMNQWLFGEPPAPDSPAKSVLNERARVWVSGVVVLEPPSHRNQGELFANWAQSRLTEIVSTGDEPPAGYTGMRYVIKKAIQDTEW